jgi:formylglycine-generating enzyme required for sulfatase activity
LLVLFGKGETAEVYTLDTAAAPKPVQTLTPAAGDALFGAVAVEDRFLVFSGPDYSKFSMAFETYQFAGSTNAVGACGKLASMADNDDATVPDIQKRLAETLAKEGIKAAADMKAYTNTIAGSTVNYVMVPVPAGEFLMGSPDAEGNRNADESPQRRVKVAPFWIGRCEVTWNEYELFMYPDDEKKLRSEIPTEEYVNAVSDAVTRPSKPYMEMSFGMGKEGYPAISMSQHAASKYCHWLSAKTGHFYRLPTEAEWEYACRAGTPTAYSFGGDAAALAEHAWFEDNADFKYQKVGRKKPNPWGLYDMHGNVAEWCLDQYEDSYARIKDSIENPWNRATQPYPHVARGGSFDDSAAKLRSAARRASDRSWKMRDPQLPKSIWWLTDAPFLGFRIVRPLTVPPPADLQKYWTSGVEKD